MTNRRLPSAATIIGRYEPSLEDWEALERAYGHQFSSHVRAAIVRLVSQFFEKSGFELDGIKADTASKMLEQLNSAAEALLVKLEADPTLPGFMELVLSKNIPAEEAYALLTRLRKDLRYFVLTMPAGIAGIDGGFQPGEAWNHMVGSVLDVLAENGLPSEIWVTDGEGKASPAVVLIDALQKQRRFPEYHRRHYASLGALKKGMQSARRRRPKS